MRVFVADRSICHVVSANSRAYGHAPQQRRLGISVVHTYRTYVLDAGGRIRGIREFPTCKDDADALTLLFELARRYRRLELWDGARLVHKIAPNPGWRVAFGANAPS